ncbi:unnamed protein product, partial [Nesidiocoris tenuis]
MRDVPAFQVVDSCLLRRALLALSYHLLSREGSMLASSTDQPISVKLCEESARNLSGIPGSRCGCWKRMHDHEFSRPF